MHERENGGRKPRGERWQGLNTSPSLFQDDFVARQTRAKPIPALAELIWNGLDADATAIRVELSHDDLAGGMSKIVVYDCGSATEI